MYFILTGLKCPLFSHEELWVHLLQLTPLMGELTTQTARVAGTDVIYEHESVWDTVTKPEQGADPWTWTVRRQKRSWPGLFSVIQLGRQARRIGLSFPMSVSCAMQFTDCKITHPACRHWGGLTCTVQHHHLQAFMRNCCIWQTRY